MSDKSINIPKSMEKNFDEDIKEILIVTSDFGAYAGTSHASKYWKASIDILAYIDNGKLVKCDGSLIWAITDEEANKRSFDDRFSTCCIYRILARHKRLKNNEELTKLNNQWYVLKVIESNVTNEELEEVLSEYKKPVVITDDILGELTLNKNLDIFTGTVMWGNDEVSISIDEEDCSAAIDACKKMLSQYEKWDKEARKIAADILTETANDWADDEEDITKDEFAKRLQISNIEVYSDGEFSIYFDDDDMFAGHCIIVDGTLEDGVSDAYMAG